MMCSNDSPRRNHRNGCWFVLAHIADKDSPRAPFPENGVFGNYDSRGALVLPAITPSRSRVGQRGAKKRPLIFFEGPICLGSLWLGEFFASANLSRYLGKLWVVGKASRPRLYEPTLSFDHWEILIRACVPGAFPAGWLFLSSLVSVSRVLPCRT
jgi:hypothetical protein